METRHLQKEEVVGCRTWCPLALVDLSLLYLLHCRVRNSQYGRVSFADERRRQIARAVATRTPINRPETGVERMEGRL